MCKKNKSPWDGEKRKYQKDTRKKQNPNKKERNQNPDQNHKTLPAFFVRLTPRLFLPKNLRSFSLYARDLATLHPNASWLLRQFDLEMRQEKKKTCLRSAWESCLALFSFSSILQPQNAFAAVAAWGKSES